MHLEGPVSLCLTGLLIGAQVGPLLYGLFLAVAFGVVERQEPRGAKDLDSDRAPSWISPQIPATCL